MTTKTIKNSIFTIEPYKTEFDSWVFDDPAVGLIREAFVAGADTLLDRMAGGKRKVEVKFSHIDFPGHDLRLDMTQTSPMGTDYFCKQLAHELWLCPALFKYYKKAPKQIYIQFKTIKNAQ